MTATTTKPKARKGRNTYEGPAPEERLVSDLVALMEQGTAPWRKEWQGHQGEHRNLLTGNVYRGSNPLLLELGAMLRGHTLPLWLGGAQAKAEGWFPRKGCTAARIIRPQLNSREEEAQQPDGTTTTELRSWVSYKITTVFNVADLVGATEETASTLAERIAVALGQAPEPKAPAVRLEAAEAALEAWPVPTSWGGSRACYVPAADQIRMPLADAFASREAMAATWAHEQVHSTGHGSRLDRKMAGTFGSKSYAREELVAELGAVLVCHRLQIVSNFENHAAYLSGWVSILKEEPRALFSVLSDARKAADLIAPEAPAPEGEAGE